MTSGDGDSLLRFDFGEVPVRGGIVRLETALADVLGQPDQRSLHRDAICGANLHAHFGHLAIDPHPPLLNPCIGFAA